MRALTIAIIINLICVGPSIADKINLDKPKFKAGDCLVWTQPVTARVSAIKIKKLSSVTFNGRTGHFYEMESNGEPFTLETFWIDGGNVRKFKCSQYDKVNSEIESQNNLIEEEKESRDNMERQARQEAFDMNIWYERMTREIDDNELRCSSRAYSQTKTDHEALTICNRKKERERDDLQQRWDKAVAEFRSKYPSLRISAEDNSVYVY